MALVISHTTQYYIDPKKNSASFVADCIAVFNAIPEKIKRANAGGELVIALQEHSPFYEPIQDALDSGYYTTTSPSYGYKNDGDLIEEEIKNKNERIEVVGGLRYFCVAGIVEELKDRGYTNVHIIEELTISMPEGFYSDE